MARIWLLVLLALSLWPSPASAGVRADVGEPPGRIGARGGDYAHEVVRSTGGLEVVQRLERFSSRTVTRLPAGGCVPSGYELMAERVRPLLRPAAASAQDAVAPLCERLPYHATAPPSLR